MQSVSPTEAEVVGADVLFAAGEDDRWSVLDEDMLLDAVEHHGFGSWSVRNHHVLFTALLFSDVNR